MCMTRAGREPLHCCAVASTIHGIHTHATVAICSSAALKRGKLPTSHARACHACRCIHPCGGVVAQLPPPLPKDGLPKTATAPHQAACLLKLLGQKHAWPAPRRVEILSHGTVDTVTPSSSILCMMVVDIPTPMRMHQQQVASHGTRLLTSRIPTMISGVVRLAISTSSCSPVTFST
jgi:hypothetical protein